MSTLSSATKVTARVTPLMLVAIGPSGSGKSTLLGTTGEKTLMLTRGIEKHGSDNAASVNSEVYVVELDKDENGVRFNADQEVERLYEVLNDPLLPQTFKVLAIDGWTEMCRMFAETSAVKAVVAKSKMAFMDEAREVESRVLALLSRLSQLNEAGMHVLTTCAGTIQTDPDDASLYEIKPNLPGHGIGQAVARCFPDIVGIGKATVLDEDTGAIEGIHKLVFHALVVKKSKNKSGAVTKQSAFSPRLRGKFGKDLPPSMPADLKALIKFRETK